jgi:hypothetical protein
LLGIFILGALLAPQARGAEPAQRSGPALLAALALMVLIIGLRKEIGADWPAYFHMFRVTAFTSFHRAVTVVDPGFMALNWIVQQAGWPIWGVNLIGALIFVFGLWRLARTQPEPWTAILVAIPYLVIVVAMNFARQGIAIGLLMAGLASLIRTASVGRFLLYMAVAATFHRTAIAVIPIALFGLTRGRIMGIVTIVGGIALLYVSLLASHVDKLFQSYLATRYAAQGAAVRVAMDVLPATAFFLLRRHLRYGPVENVLWRNFSIAAFAALGALLTIKSSAAVDRFAIYLLPLQIVVISRLPIAFRSPILGRALVAAYSAAVLFVWLNYADNASAWLPYKHY